METRFDADYVVYCARLRRAYNDLSRRAETTTDQGQRLLIEAQAEQAKARCHRAEAETA